MPDLETTSGVCGEVGRGQLCFAAKRVTRTAISPRFEIPDRCIEGHFRSHVEDAILETCFSERSELIRVCLAGVAHTLFEYVNVRGADCDGLLGDEPEQKAVDVGDAKLQVQKRRTLGTVHIETTFLKRFL